MQRLGKHARISIADPIYKMGFISLILKSRRPTLFAECNLSLPIHPFLILSNTSVRILGFVVQVCDTMIAKK